MQQSDRRPILIVDDDPDMREALREALAMEGYEVAEAADGSEALRHLRSFPLPSLILLDWNMAPMNGQRFMEELSKEPPFANVPVVLLTADHRVKPKAETARFAGYLTKPVEIDTLFAFAERFASGRI